MARQVFVPTTTRITMAPSYSIPTATMSKRSATCRGEHGAGSATATATTRATVAAATAALLVLLARCTSMTSAPEPAVPEALRPSSKEILILKAHAVGVQIYVCQASHDDPASFDWV